MNDASILASGIGATQIRFPSGRGYVSQIAFRDGLFDMQGGLICQRVVEVVDFIVP